MKSLRLFQLSQQKEGQLASEEENIQARYAAVYIEISRNKWKECTTIHLQLMTTTALAVEKQT